MRKILFSFLMACLAVGPLFAFSSRTDFRDESIYFIMTTRFYDGDPSNNTQCWDAQNYNTGDSPWRGDFKGLIEKMDYIKALGFTAIWMTPVVENASGYDYHGYHASDFSKVDHRYESGPAGAPTVGFQDVIDAAHAKGMKIILDIVINHTGNFGEGNLCKLFTRDWNADQSNIDACMVPYTKKDGGRLPDNYLSLAGGLQYSARLAEMKNTDGQNHDTHNYWHHYGNFNWDDDTRWWAQIAGDCVDLNTENQAVVNYLVECYGKFIKMGVDGFRIDTSGHISRLTFNKNFIPQFHEIANSAEAIAKRGNTPFFMFGEVCSRDRNVMYRNQPRLSPYFYTWKETKTYAWDTSTTSWEGIAVPEGSKGSHTNVTSVDQHADDYQGEKSWSATSTNHKLSGNAYHTPDYSQASGFNVIDFPMHWNFRSANEAWGVKSGDNLYNDATYNVVYVDSHDYAPDGAPEGQRFSGDQSTWAENMALMFTFRGIPCIYYGSEIEFKKGSVIDKGPNIALNETGRAYFGGYIKGDIDVTDFGKYTATGNAKATLGHPLALHVQRLNLIRQAVPALRKGQYSTDGCSGSFAFKRRYTDSSTDSYALVCISGGATFTGIENGTYTDCVTGDVKTVTDGKLTVSCSGKGNLRVYVLSTSKTSAPGKIGVDGKYIYASSPASISAPAWDGSQEEKEADRPVVTLNPASGYVGLNGTVTITASAGTIYYTTDGTTPSASSTKYTAPVVITKDQTTVKAIAISGSLTSNVASGTYTIYKPITVTLNPASGYVGPNGTVTITASEGTIYYTTDGSTPSASSTKYTAPVVITQNKTVLSAIAIKDGRKSTVVSGKFLTEKPAGLSITFKAPQGWSNVMIWVWDNDAKNYTGGTWPGVAMEQSGDTYTYVVETDVRPLNVIFSSGGAQTADLTGIEDDEVCFDASNLPSCDKCTPRHCGEEEEPAKSVTVRLKAANCSYTQPYIYTWEGMWAANWPGVQMTRNGDWWEFNGDCVSTYNVIFNDGGHTQTSDIKGLTGDKCFEMTGDNSAKEVDCDGTSGDDPEPITEGPCLKTADEHIVFCKRTSAFNQNINVYIWDSSDGDKKICGAWPGTAATAIGNDYYSFAIPASETITSGWKIIWNDGSNQTADLEFKDRHVYTIAKKDADSPSVEVTEICSQTGVGAIDANPMIIYAVDGQIFCNESIRIYTVTGINVTRMNGSLPSGIYLVKTEKSVQKVIVE